jgi:hypothetical protein
MDVLAMEGVSEMRLARKLVLFAGVALMALAMSPGAVSAQELEVHDETEGVVLPCGGVALVVHTVSGGCHAEFRSEGNVTLVAHVPTPVSISNCQFHLDARIGTDGGGYVTRAVLSPPAPPFGPGCTRAHCDEAASAPNPHAELPWTIHFNESAGALSAEIRLCLRVLSAGEGGTPGYCTLHLPVTDQGDHNYELGTSNLEAFCEPGDWDFGVSFLGSHFLNETPPGSSAEDIEIVH